MATDAIRRNRRPSTPGEILKGLYLEPNNVEIKELAALLEVSVKHASQLVNGHARLSPELAAKLGKICGNGAAIWLRLQAAVDAWDAEAAGQDWQPARTIGGHLAA